MCLITSLRVRECCKVDDESHFLNLKNFSLHLHHNILCQRHYPIVIKIGRHCGHSVQNFTAIRLEPSLSALSALHYFPIKVFLIRLLFKFLATPYKYSSCPAQVFTKNTAKTCGKHAAKRNECIFVVMKTKFNIETFSRAENVFCLTNVVVCTLQIFDQT